MMRSLRNERGVAMATVLFIGSALTVIASTGAYVAVRDLKVGRDDRRGAEALSFAEAGVDRMVDLLRNGGTYVQSTASAADRQSTGIPSWAELNEAGCALGPLRLPAGQLGTGRTYDVYLTVYDPTKPVGQRVPPLPWTVSNDTSSPVCTGRVVSPAATPSDSDHLFAISSMGSHPAAKRQVLQVIEIDAAGLPIGLFAQSASMTGNADIESMSLVTPGDVSGREKVSFKGLDPYYTMADFYGSAFASAGQIPAAVHALGVVTCVSNCNTAGSGQGRKQVHPPALNCGANGTGDGAPAWQSMWDGSGLGGPISGDCTGRNISVPPPTSRFDSATYQRVSPRPDLTEEDYERLKEAAKTHGVYCTNIGTSYCQVRGGPNISLGTFMTWTDSTITTYNLTRFVVYFDFAPGSNQTVTWNAALSPCSDTDPSANRSAVVVARHGNIKTQGAGAGEAVGAWLLPEGTFDAGGSITIHGTIIANKIEMRGNTKFKNSNCWMKTMPGAFLDYTATHWSEVDR